MLLTDSYFLVAPVHVHVQVVEDYNDGVHRTCKEKYGFTNVNCAKVAHVRFLVVWLFI